MKQRGKKKNRQHGIYPVKQCYFLAQRLLLAHQSSTVCSVSVLWVHWALRRGHGGVTSVPANAAVTAYARRGNVGISRLEEQKLEREAGTLRMEALRWWRPLNENRNDGEKNKPLRREQAQHEKTCRKIKRHKSITARGWWSGLILVVYLSEYWHNNEEKAQIIK